MKKIIGILMALSLSFGLFAKENLISFSVGVSTGIPFYGSFDVNSNNAYVNGNRIIIGGVTSVNLNIIDQVTFFLGSDVLSDFNWRDPFYSDHVHVDFTGGIKLYPGLGGLCGGIGYTVGFRSDYDCSYDYAKVSNSTAWGNGVKVLLEYNFAYSGPFKKLPSAGVYWKWMPRGLYTYDNMICAYLSMNF